MGHIMVGWTSRSRRRGWRVVGKKQRHAYTHNLQLIGWTENARAAVEWAVVLAVEKRQSFVGLDDLAAAIGKVQAGAVPPWAQ